MLGIGVGNMLTEEEMEMLESSIKVKTAEIDSEVRVQMTALRNGYGLATDLLATGLNSNIATTYNQYTDNLLTFYEASDDNRDLINYNINNKREERYEQLEHSKHIKEIIQKSIAGACIVATSVVSIISIPVTAGTSAAAFLATVGTLATAIGGINAIVEGATDYQNNVVVISQCVNMGKMEADDSEYIGGIVGHLEQKGCVFDCLNAGKYTGESDANSGGLIGRCSSRAEIQRCLAIGQGCKDPLMDSDGTSVSYDDLYYYDDVFPDAYYPVIPGTPLSLEDLCLSKSYKNWDINDDKSRWQVSGEKGNYPIPYRSEMQDEIEENE